MLPADGGPSIVLPVDGGPSDALPASDAKTKDALSEPGGLICDAEVILMPRKTADQGSSSYKPCKMRTMVVDVQRLVLIQRVEDAHETTDNEDLYPKVHAN